MGKYDGEGILYVRIIIGLILFFIGTNLINYLFQHSDVFIALPSCWVMIMAGLGLSCGFIFSYIIFYWNPSKSGEK